MSDLIPDISVLSLWLLNYGSFVLFFMLALGIIALPIPEETLMTLAGVLMREGKLNIPLTVFFAYAGALTGITLSYVLGRTAGTYFVQKYGRHMGISEARLLKMHYWFERFGKWLLTIGYFIPGLRHLTGFFAGTTDLKYAHFALFAYCGALIWVSTFLSLGFFVGDFIFVWLEHLEIFDIIFIALIVIFFIAVFFLVVRRIMK